MNHPQAVGAKSLHKRPDKKNIPVILKIVSPSPPDYVKVRWQPCTVKALAPRPKCCPRCLQFIIGRHRSTQIEAICAKCATTGHAEAHCPSLTAKCTVCHEADHTCSPECPTWKHECTGLSIASEQNIPPNEARKIADKKRNEHGAYSQAVKCNLPRPTTSPTTPSMPIPQQLMDTIKTLLNTHPISNKC